MQYFLQEIGTASTEDQDDESHIFNLNLAKDNDVNLYLNFGTMYYLNQEEPLTFIGKLISES